MRSLTSSRSMLNLSICSLLILQLSLGHLLKANPVNERLSADNYLPAHMAAQEVNVFVSSQQINKDIWVANGLYQVNEKRNYEKAVLMDFVVKTDEASPSARPADVLKAPHAYQKEYSERITQGGAGIVDWQTTYDVANSMFNIIGTINVPGVPTGAAVAKGALFWAQKGMRASFASEMQLLGQNQLFNSSMQFSEYQKDVLAAGYYAARRNPQAAQVINTFPAPDLKRHDPLSLGVAPSELLPI